MMLLADFNPMTLWGVGLLLIVLVVLRFAFRARKPAQPTRQPAPLPEPAELGAWEVKMHDTARDLLGDVNTRVALLEQLIHDANTAATRLEKALDRAQAERS